FVARGALHVLRDRLAPDRIVRKKPWRGRTHAQRRGSDRHSAEPGETVRACQNGCPLEKTMRHPSWPVAASMRTAVNVGPCTRMPTPQSVLNRSALNSLFSGNTWPASMNTAMSRYRDGRQRYSPVNNARLRSVNRRVANARIVEPLPRYGARIAGVVSPGSDVENVARPRNASTYCSLGSGTGW